ncbi:hypothetical protein M513_11464 [Trichuris suis]|uniref:Uncharacterized protein n=1 Tax=Trichuris suis TaxID=68888 RepID=A0A085LRS7_9BILA|nr:hypothetical protein M513_11464 [Trichuris suis]
MTRHCGSPEWTISLELAVFPLCGRDLTTWWRPSQIASEVRDLLLAPPAAAPYDKVREALIRRTSVPRHTRIQELLNADEFGDQCPSQLLRHMRQLVAD